MEKRDVAASSWGEDKHEPNEGNVASSFHDIYATLGCRNEGAFSRTETFLPATMYEVDGQMQERRERARLGLAGKSQISPSSKAASLRAMPWAV
jgi:hypothetical protein